ncbi:hypothetical protein [Methylobacter sp. BlB1]|uniref:hypothetical protein n=1 Tax=Methylobacter sp. BlB1 TaxID=2785914 RepID=UPI0018937D61|nr:hypothetical protein [Methylobacter sp. BlB1]MBF6649752.1 hypothetical protein [Methylobacter sp. BlB1]
MTDTYNDALAEQMKKNVWDNLKSEAANMTPMEYATVSADIAGIFDPTPVSDGAGFLLSAAQGDALGALLSLGSMIPYAGDALAKPAKIVKRAPKTAKALEAMLQAKDNLAKVSKGVLKESGLNPAKIAEARTDFFKNSGLSLEQVAKARRQALDKVQQAMLDAKNKTPGVETCPRKLVDEVTGEKRQLQMPISGKNGKWKTPEGEQPVDGNGIFEFAEPKKLPDGRMVEEIEFRNGAPDFDKYVEGSKYDLWEVDGNAKIDGDQLAKMMRETNPNWNPPSKDDFVLHHFEDGKVGYVPKVIHNKPSGVGHTGGNSMTNNQLF